MHNSGVCVCVWCPQGVIISSLPSGSYSSHYLIKFPFLSSFQGGEGGGVDSLDELSQRFGFEPDLSNDGIQEKLKELQEKIKKNILTEMKIKEGAENLRKVTSDKKKSHVNSIVKEANSKLEDLNEQLQEVNAYLLGTNSRHAPSSGW